MLLFYSFSLRTESFVPKKIFVTKSYYQSGLWKTNPEQECTSENWLYGSRKGKPGLWLCIIM